MNYPKVLLPVVVSAVFLLIPFAFAYLVVLGKISTSQNIPLYIGIFITSLLFAGILSRLLIQKIELETKNLLLLIFGLCVVSYAIFILLITYSNYSRMVSPSIDVFYYHQVVWQLSEFKIPYLYRFSQSLYPAWSQHFEPILYLISPFYWLVKDAAVLMILQAAVFVSGALPIYLTVKRRFGSRFLGTSIAFSYLAFGGTQFGIAYGFHPIMLFPTVFLWMYYFYLQKNIKLYFLFVILSLFVKEEVAFIMIFWGIYLLVFKKDKLGLLTSILGLLWYLLCFSVIFPKFSAGGFGYWGQYDVQGATGVFGIFQFVFFHPLKFLKTLITPSYKIDTIFQSFGSFGYLPLLFPPSIVILFPSLMEKLLSSGIAAINGTHYSAALTGTTLVSMFESLLFLTKRNLLARYIQNKNIFFGLFIFYIALFFNLIFGYYAFSLFPTAVRTAFVLDGNIVDPSEQNLNLLDQAIASIPKNATVAVEYEIATHMNRDYKLITTIPNKNEDADYVLVDASLPPPTLTKAEDINNYLFDLVKTKKYKVNGSLDGITLLKKIK